MRIALLLLLVMVVEVAWSQTTPPPQPQRRIYTHLISDVPPEVRTGRTFVPIRVVSEQFGASVRWTPATREIFIARTGQPNIVLTLGSTTARVGNNTITLDAAPYITNGRTMVPLRFIAETYGAPVEYNEPTRSVHLYRNERIYVLPLESTATGIFIFDPRPGELVRNPIRVQGQANVFEGALIIEVRTSTGRVLGRTIATAGMGGFYPYSVPVYYNLPSEDPVRGRIVVFAEDPSGRRQVLVETSVEVILASTI